MPINLTPECFMHMVVVGLYWEHGEPVEYRTATKKVAYRKGFTTVDHILRIFCALGVITDLQIKKLIQDKRMGVQHQRYLFRYTGRTSQGQYVMDNSSLICVREDDALRGTVKLLALVTNKQIEITEAGKKRAVEYEQEFIQFGITRKKYLDQVEKWNSLFKTEAATIAASKKYRARVSGLISSEED